MFHPIVDGKVHAVSLQYIVATHCNLRCADCSHLAPFVAPRLTTAEEMRRDLERLAPVVHATHLDLTGGEALLHPQITALARVARACGIADEISLSTNGLLLDRADDELWTLLDEVRLSVYPDAAPSLRTIEAAMARAEATDTVLRIRCMTQFRAAFAAGPRRSALATWLVYQTCGPAHLRQCHTLYRGHLYQCCVPVVVRGYEERLGRDEYNGRDDGLDIHASADLGGDVRRYLNRWRPLASCRYCMGSVSRTRPHRQLTEAELANASLPGGQLDYPFLARSLVRRMRRETLGRLGKPLTLLRARRTPPGRPSDEDF